MDAALTRATNWLAAHPRSTCLLLSLGLIIVLKMDLPK